MSALIDVRKQGSTAWLSLNNPSHRNALTLDMWQRLRAVLGELDEDSGIRIVVIAGTQGHFSSGADISEFPRVRFDETSIRRYDQAVHNAITALSNLRALSLAMIEGDAVGGGAEIALAADWRFGGNASRIGITPTTLGIVYGPEETWHLMQLVGPSRALDLLVTGRLLSAADALDMGLLDRVVADDMLEDTVRQFVDGILANSAAAVRATKEMVRRLLEGTSVSHPMFDALVYDLYATGDYRERIEKFLRRSTHSRRPNA